MTPGGQGRFMKPRNLNADLIRCVAVYSVVSVHFLLNTGFYSVATEGPLMLFMCMVRSLFMVCVPLFMILSGYLMWQKTLSKAYYKGLLKTLEIYVMASIACLLFKRFVQGDVEVTLRSGMLGILDFDAANYAWYIEMYIGLFLLIPFLNLAYHGLKSQREKQALVVTMILLTLAPKLLNNFNFTLAGWWDSPSSADKYDPLVPGFFTAMYPITYYFIGAYLREYDWKISKKKNVVLLILAVILFGCYNYWRSDGGKFVWASNSTWGGENLITASLLFVLLLHIKMEKWPVVFKAVLTYISNISLGIYLVSWIFDRIVYDGFLKSAVPEITERWKFYPIAVPAVFFGSAGLATLLYLIRHGLHKIAQQNKYSHDGQ